MSSTKIVCLVLPALVCAVAVKYNLITFLIVKLGLIILCVYLYMQYKFRYWKRRNIPFVKPEFPFGYLRPIYFKKQHFINIFTKIYNDYSNERFVGLYAFHYPVLLIRDLEIVKAISSTDHDNFRTRGVLNSVPYTESILSADLADVKEVRNKIDEAFSSGKVRTSMFKIMIDASDDFVVYLKKCANNGTVLDLREAASKFSLNVYGAAAMGVECDSFGESFNPYKSISKMTFDPKSNAVFIKIVSAIFIPRVVELLRIKNHFDQHVLEFFTFFCDQKMEQRRNATVKRTDMMDEILSLLDNDKPVISKQELVAHVIALLAAGYESSGSLFSFAFYHLALHPEIQERAREEVLRITKIHGDINYEAVLEMKYVGAILDETIRLHPPISLLTRDCTRTCTLPNTDVTIEKGTKIIMPTYAILRDPKLYPNPDTFDPDRVFTENWKNVCTMMPFGFGPRACPGKRFSLIEGRVVIAKILSNFRLKSTPDTPKDIVLDPNSFALLSKFKKWATVELL